MWVTSVEPMPSMISVPVSPRQRSNRCAGSASPAETQKRNEDKSGRSVSNSAIWRANRVGTPKKTVGRKRVIAANVLSGVGRSGISTVVPPTQSGKAIALPRP